MKLYHSNNLVPKASTVEGKGGNKIVAEGKNGKLDMRGTSHRHLKVYLKMLHI